LTPGNGFVLAMMNRCAPLMPGALRISAMCSRSYQVSNAARSPVNVENARKR